MGGMNPMAGMNMNMGMMGNFMMPGMGGGFNNASRGRGGGHGGRNAFGVSPFQSLIVFLQAQCLCRWPKAAVTAMEVRQRSGVVRIEEFSRREVLICIHKVACVL